jgi:hypothetical protein
MFKIYKSSNSRPSMYVLYNLEGLALYFFLQKMREEKLSPGEMYGKKESLLCCKLL